MTYELTPSAEEDIVEIIQYTEKEWGIDAVEKYVRNLEKKLDEIGTGLAVKRQFQTVIPQLYVTKFRYHLIFYFHELGAKPAVIRILHEKRDIVSQLEKTFRKLHWVKGEKPIDLQ